MRLAVCCAIALGCGAPPTPPAPPAPVPEANAELSAALRPLAWMLGDWQGTHGTEKWVAAGGAMYGVGFAKDGSFDVMIIDDSDVGGHLDGVLRFYASPNGTSRVEFRRREGKDRAIVFANPKHDFPKTIAYRGDGDGLAARIGDDAAKHVDFAFRPAKLDRALDLEAADRAFSDATIQRGIDGWLAAFDEKAGMLKNGDRIEGHAAIKELMGPLLASGKLSWQPIASGTNGKLGFTVGKATFAGAKPEASWKSSYVTIWKYTEAGPKVLFDTGRVVNE